MISRKRISRRHLTSILVSAMCWSVLPGTALAAGEVEAQPLVSVKSSQAPKDQNLTPERTVTLSSTKPAAVGDLNGRSIRVERIRPDENPLQVNVLRGENRFYSGAVTDVVRETDTGIQMLVVLADESAPSAYVYDFGSETTLELQNDGSISIAQFGVYVGSIDSPWAMDRDGRTVPTSYEIVGHQLIQHVRHSGFSYPVTADPSITIGWNIYLWVNHSEVLTFLNAAVVTQMALLCSWSAGLLCAINAFATAYVVAGLNNVKATGCRYKVAFRPGGFPNWVERLAENGCSFKHYELPW